MIPDTATAVQIRLYIPAIPVAQPRVRATVVAGHASVYTPGTVNGRPHPIHEFKATVRKIASEKYTGAPLRCAVRVDAIFVFPRPRSDIWKKRPMPRYPHVKKPDRDNLDKGLLDALKGIILEDDRQVCDGRIEKWVASGDEQPHVEVTIQTVPVVKVTIERIQDPQGGLFDV